MTTIAVTGAATRSIPATRGTVRIDVAQEGDRAEPVVRAVERVRSQLVAEVRALVEAGAVLDWTADRVTSTSFPRHSDPDRPRELVHVTRASLSVTFGDLAELGAWTGRAASLDAVEVTGVDWSVADEQRHEVETEVRAEAVADARIRAEGYARAAGLGLPTLEALWEPGLRPGGAGSSGGAGPAMFRAASFSKASGPDFEFTPAAIEITAEISADYRCA